MSASVASSLSSSLTSSNESAFAGKFSRLYCGTVCIVQSFLSMHELLQLARVSHYYRDVAIGTINPTGLTRPGQELPFVSWNALRVQPAKFAKATKQQAIIIPDLLQIADNKLGEIQQLPCEKRQDEPSLEAFIAIIPAPSYGASRTVHVSTLSQYSQLLVSPIVGRHMQKLSTWYPFLTSDLALLSLRFPYLRLLRFHELGWSTEQQQDWRGLKFTTRFPAPLLELEIKMVYQRNEIEKGNLVKTILPLLPDQCPYLQSLQIAQDIPPTCDLSPLLRLPHLTSLLVGCISYLPNSPSTYNHGLVVQQLTRLKYLSVNKFDYAYLPCSTSLEKVELLNNLNPELLGLLIDRTPELRVFTSFKVWQLANYSDFSRFSSLEQVKYKQDFCMLLHLPQGLDWTLSQVGIACIAEFGSLERHVAHVISAFSHLRCLTDLHLESVYTPLASRSLIINADYFESRKLTSNDERLYWEPHASTVAPVVDWESATQLPKLMGLLAPCCDQKDPGLRLHPVFQFAQAIPQLVKLKLDGLASLHLPSLAFLSGLPQLQSLSVSDAYFLPIESLYNLRFVAATLTELRIAKCFPFDFEGKPMYLMHDVLKPLQLSFPVTRVLTINLPGFMKKSFDEDDEARAQAHKETATAAYFTVENDSTDDSAASSSSSSSSFPTSAQSCIPPRHSNWFEILKNPPPRDERKQLVNVPSFLEYKRRTWVPDLVPVGDVQYCRNSDNYPYQLVFDSFTAAVDLPDDEDDDLDLDDRSSLTSLLLPNLVDCSISHSEPHTPDMYFWYKRSESPRHTLDASTSLDEGEIERRRQLMNTKYGLPLDCMTDVEMGSSTYCCFLSDWSQGYHEQRFENVYKIVK